MPVTILTQNVFNLELKILKRLNLEMRKLFFILKAYTWTLWLGSTRRVPRELGSFCKHKCRTIILHQPPTCIKLKLHILNHFPFAQETVCNLSWAF